MITEEKLQQFLDDLRIGKYDSMNYKITAKYLSLIIKDINKNISVQFTLSYGQKMTDVAEKLWKKSRKHKFGSFWYKYYNRKFDLISKDTPYEYSIIVCDGENISSESTFVSYNLYKSFETFIKEQQEKDKLIQRANIESAFGL